MNRRKFILTCGALASPLVSARTPSTTRDLGSIVIPGAYVLWYNRPSMTESKGDLVVAHTTSIGDICVTAVNRNLKSSRTIKLHRFEGVSDHSAPSIVRIPKGPFAGHILVFFSNHASELFIVRSKYADSIDDWEDVQVLDRGRVTYPAAYLLNDGTIGLQYTRQYRDEGDRSIHWRTTVHRFSKDGGLSWDERSALLDFGINQFPYSTPVAISPNGRCALAYSIYSSINKRNRGLWVLISDDGFTSFRQINVVMDIGVYSYIPYELKWKNNQTLMLSYSTVNDTDSDATGSIAYINTRRRQVKTFRIGSVEMHNYPGGAALVPATDSVIYSPLGGGLTQLSLRNKAQTVVEQAGDFASPFVFESSSGRILVALMNPSVKTTRNFSADLLIKRLSS